MTREQAEKLKRCTEDLLVQLRELETPCRAYTGPSDRHWCMSHDEKWPCTRLGLRRAMEAAEAALEEVG